MSTSTVRTNAGPATSAWAVTWLAFFAGLGCSSGPHQTSARGDASTGGSETDAAAEGGISGAIPIIAGGSPDVPYQFDLNTYGVAGAAFFTKSTQGADTVVLDKTRVGTVCLTGNVDIVPTPADGGHPPYVDFWGIEVGFNLNQDPDAGRARKTPWVVPPHVIGFWFTVEGPSLPDIRFKTTPTGKDPAKEQDSCAVVSPASGVPNRVLFTDMYVQCWAGPQGTAPTDVTVGLLDVGLQVAADTDRPHSVDFCWTDFGVIKE